MTASTDSQFPLQLPDEAEALDAPDGTANWIQTVADQLEARVADRQAGRAIVCASGISPSGPIHLGNLREIITTHFIVEELRSRGREAIHLHSWDDYDRFRKVPGGIPSDFENHIGMPLAAVPDPCGNHDSFASHFIEEFTASLDRLGIEIAQVRQSRRYTSGIYNAAIRIAMSQRTRIFDILAKYQTPGLHTQPLEDRRRRYYPFRPYCALCGRDDTTVVGYDEPGQLVSYRCRCRHEAQMSLADGASITGKLVWKVDWPMRWVHEGVDFEPGGEDHSGPGSSFDAAQSIVGDVFGGAPPHYVGYAFVGLSGATTKMSGSAGGAAIPATALDVLEPCILRWLYARKAPHHAFSIDLAPWAVQRNYQEWDQFIAQASSSEASTAEANLRRACLQTSTGRLPSTPLPAPFRLLGAAADLTQGNREQIARIVAQHLSDRAGADRPISIQELEPRLTCAINWATILLPPEERTVVRNDFNADEWERLDSLTRRGIEMVRDEMDSRWSLEGLTALVYNTPKVLAGLGPDTPPTPELKKRQRAFFVALYRMLCSADTGPRLPTLFLSIGSERTRRLFSPPHLASTP